MAPSLFCAHHCCQRLVLSALASGIMIVMLMLLPETQGRSLASLEVSSAPTPSAAVADS